MYDDPEDEIVTKYTLLIYVNSLQILVSKTLQKMFYRENSTMNQFRMIPEPYLRNIVSPKV
jgi:hypothetical protein